MYLWPEKEVCRNVRRKLRATAIVSAIIHLVAMPKSSAKNNHFSLVPMDNSTSSEEFYKNLRQQLADTSLWPNEYLYKFIVPSDNQKIAEIEAIFDNMGAVINTKASSKGRYTSVSVNVRMKNPDAVILKYKEVGEKVDGVISL